MTTDATAAFEAHCEAWNQRDRSRWLSLFAEDVVLEDPVGAAPKHGRTALETTWDRSQTDTRQWTLKPRRVVSCGAEVAVDLVNHGQLPSGEVAIESIEIFRVNADGLIASVRSFFDSDPAVHDPYYLR